MASISETDSEATIEFLGESFTGSTEEYGVDITITRVSNGQITPMSVNMKSLLRDLFVDYCQLNHVLEEALERCAFWFENSVMDLELTIEDHRRRPSQFLVWDAYGARLPCCCYHSLGRYYPLLFPFAHGYFARLARWLLPIGECHPDIQERSMLHSDNCYNDSAWENLKDRGLFSIGLDESVIMVLG